jgi:hypothetical protein
MDRQSVASRSIAAIAEIFASHALRVGEIDCAFSAARTDSDDD